MASISNVKLRLLFLIVLVFVANFILIVTTRAERLQTTAWTPVVMWHGMGDTAHGSIEVIKRSLESKYPGMYVLSIQIGNSVVEDELASYFGNANEQVDEACRQVLSDNRITKHGSLNVIGFSQGGQLSRALVQRCPLTENNVTVKNYISLGGQHQGVFGLPHCSSDNELCKYARYLIETAVYSPLVQPHVIQAQYWHDPINDKEYREKSTFLADINNERAINETYRKNILKLQNMVLVMFANDEIMVPRESATFGFYNKNLSKVESMNETELYQQDRLGLKSLNQSQRLSLITIPGGHLQFKMRWFMYFIATKYLSN
ncbi:Palmitoyl-protein thioesterase 1, partial [Fragariocoptes setiger]